MSDNDGKTTNDHLNEILGREQLRARAVHAYLKQHQLEYTDGTAEFAEWRTEFMSRREHQKAELALKAVRAGGFEEVKAAAAAVLLRYFK